MAFNNSVNAENSGFQSLTTGGVWNGRTLTPGTGMSISNGDGIAGNPTISTSGTGPGSWTFIETKTASGGTTLTFNTSLSSYTELMFVIQNMSVTASQLSYLISTDNGSTNVTGTHAGVGSTTQPTGNSSNPTYGYLLFENLPGSLGRMSTFFDYNSTSNNATVSWVASAVINWLRFTAAGGMTGSVDAYGR